MGIFFVYILKSSVCLVYYQCGRLHMDIALCRQGKKEPSTIARL